MEGNHAAKMTDSRSIHPAVIPFADRLLRNAEDASARIYPGLAKLPSETASPTDLACDVCPSGSSRAVAGNKKQI